MRQTTNLVCDESLFVLLFLVAFCLFLARMLKTSATISVSLSSIFSNEFSVNKYNHS